MYIQTIKISSKGQLVLPKKVRSILGGNIISIKVDDNNLITLSTAPSLAGSLAAYVRDTAYSFKQVREKPWKDNIAASSKETGE